MPPRHVVVDGSNLATEGRSLPSLVQLDEAVRAYKEEWPDHDVLVVVDASFSYRIDESERDVFEGAENAGEVVSPPAGAIGRGDGFLLRIADRTDAVVLSNDSFQEFHGEYPWLFDEGRLVGGKPVPGVGWIFTPRSPVRGPKSRVSVRDAKTKRRAPRAEPVAQAIAEATAEAVSPDPEPTARRGSGRRRGRGAAPVEASPEAINEPLPFITFIAEHRLGTEVEGTVDSFTSHGAFVVADGARCYAPVVGLGDPPPRSAKDVLTRGEVRTFIVQALDAPRRGIELALPGLARVAGAPTEETVEAEIDVAVHPDRRRSGARTAPPEDQVPFDELKPPPPPRARRSRAPAPVAEQAEPEPEVAEPAPVPEPAPVAAATGGPRRNAVRRAPAAAKAATPAPAPARKARAKKAAAPVPDVAAVAVEPEKAPARKAAARKATRKAAAVVVDDAPVPEREPAPAVEPAAAKKSARKAPARKAAAVTVEAPPTDPAEPAAPAEKAATRKVAAKKVSPKKAAAAAKAAPKKTPAPKPAAKAAGPKKAPAKRAAKKVAPAPTG